MPIYTLLACDGSGDALDVYRSVDERPRFGARYEIDGRVWERQPELVASPIMVPTVTSPITAISQPINDPAAPRVNQHGEAVFHNAAEIREYNAKRRARGVKNAEYDRPGFRG